MPNGPDLVIIGGGPAGLTAGIYACRARLQTVLLEKTSPGGQVLVTDYVENYPGFPDKVSGYALIDQMVAQAKRFGLSIENGEVASVAPRQDKGVIELGLAGGKTLSPRSVIVATGASPNQLGVPGEKELTGKGVSYCAVCDGPFFRDQEVAVVGGGDSAVQEALFLTKIVKKVYLIHRRDELRAIKLLQERALSEPKIQPVWNSVVEKINGSDQVESLSLLNRETGEHSSLSVQGVFIFVGIQPNTSFLKNLLKTDERGFIITDEWMRTSVQGIFAAGDCRAKPLRQISTPVGDGACAAFAVEHMLNGY